MGSGEAMSDRDDVWERRGTPAPTPQPPGDRGAYEQPPGRGTSGLAIASLVLGIVWVFWIGSILAVIFGHIALSRIKASRGMIEGKGLAIAGLVLGYLGIATLVLWIIFFVFLGAATQGPVEGTGG
jgi:Domain of unknown function (DUF4190)